MTACRGFPDVSSLMFISSTITKDPDWKVQNTFVDWSPDFIAYQSNQTGPNQLAIVTVSLITRVVGSTLSDCITEQISLNTQRLLLTKEIVFEAWRYERGKKRKLMIETWFDLKHI